MESCQDSVHQAREGGRSAAENEGYLIELKELSTACAESGLLLVLFLDGDLPVPAFEIQRCEPAGVMKSVEEIVDPWNGMGIFDHCCIELSKIDTKAEAAILFLDHDHREAQGLLEGLMAPVESICCTCAISSLLTAGFWRRYGWRRGGPSVSIVCCNSGVQSRSSSPWLKISSYS